MPASPPQPPVMQNAKPVGQAAAQGALVGLDVGPLYQHHELGMSSAPSCVTIGLVTW